MMDRITEKHLQALCDRLNRITNSPETPYKKDGNQFIAQIGNYHLDFAYGGVELVRMSNLGGGVDNPLRTGHVPKRELYNRMQAYIAGMEEKR
jgi:hypothetical protein